VSPDQILDQISVRNRTKTQLFQKLIEIAEAAL
jgi:hypothetical protein